MNIDEHIQQALRTEAQHLDDILAHEPGLFTRLGKVYKSSMRVCVSIATLFGLMVSAALIYSGYLFYVAASIDDRIFWAVWFLISFMALVAIKMWIFMEMNRTSTLREVKRVEIALERLQKQLLGEKF